MLARYIDIQFTRRLKFPFTNAACLFLGPSISTWWSFAKQSMGTVVTKGKVPRQTLPHTRPHSCFNDALNSPPTPVCTSPSRGNNVKNQTWKHVCNMIRDKSSAAFMQCHLSGHYGLWHRIPTPKSPAPATAHDEHRERETERGKNCVKTSSWSVQLDGPSARGHHRPPRGGAAIGGIIVCSEWTRELVDAFLAGKQFHFGRLWV